MLRVAGLALLGVAAGALLVGLITLGVLRGGGGGDGGNAAPTTVQTTGGGATGLPGTTTGNPSPAPGTGTAAPAPSTTTQAPPAATPAPPPAPRPSIRVYNNSRISGLAQQAADDFIRHGWNVVTVGNYPERAARLTTSTVYFRPGTGEEAAAQELAKQFNLKVEPRFNGIERVVGADPGLIVIATNDYGSK
jgi:LytR cell envelope-related transcriptional attenuator